MISILSSSCVISGVMVFLQCNDQFSSGIGLNGDAFVGREPGFGQPLTGQDDGGFELVAPEVHDFVYFQGAFHGI